MARSPTIAIGLLVAVLAAFVVVRSFDVELLNHDVAWLLHGAERMLDGARYHDDWVDVSPPSILWLTMVPAAVARVTGGPPMLVYNLFVYLLALAAAGLCDRILRGQGGEGAAGYRQVLTGSVIALPVLLPGFDFGQREHLLVILTLPYLVGAAAALAGRSVPRPLGMAVGLLAAVGLALKPHFLLLWIAVEAYLLRRCPQHRTWGRVENGVIVAGQAIYAIAVLVFTPEYRRVAEMALQVYGAYDVDLGVFLLGPAAGVLAVAVVLFALVRPTDLNRELRAVLLLAAVVLFGIALLQGKGFSYHLAAPLLTGALLVVVVAAGLLGREGALAALVRPGVGVLPVVALGILIGGSAVRLADGVHRAWGGGRSAPSLIRTLADAVAREAGGGNVLALSTSLHPLFPAVDLGGASWSSRFSCLWPLPGLYPSAERDRRPFPYHPLAEMGDTERYVVDAVVEDLRRGSPRLIVVDATPVKQGFGPAPTAFDFLEYFSRDERFARMFESYRHLGDIGPYRFYRNVSAPPTRGGP